ncbi:hypothetical protein LV779_36590 [Streptomyces thinghirensis]|nr:hypothetical protein [Streptomyces thinghirensis]
MSAGITVDHVSGVAGRRAPIVLEATGLALAAATGGTALIGRRLSRQTHGLGPVQMTRMYEHHDAVLHSVREGVLIVDPHGCLLLANDEARRLLALPERERSARRGTGAPSESRTAPSVGHPRPRTR